MKKLILACMFMISLIGCMTRSAIFIPTDKYEANYEKMFKAAITEGVRQGFKPTYQDKEMGLLTMERVMDKDTIWTINIQFGNITGGQGFEITGRGTDGTPIVGMVVNPIKEAILQAAGMPVK